jgi:hypothetical protein
VPHPYKALTDHFVRQGLCDSPPAPPEPTPLHAVRSDDNHKPPSTTARPGKCRAAPNARDGRGGASLTVHRTRFCWVSGNNGNNPSSPRHRTPALRRYRTSTEAVRSARRPGKPAKNWQFGIGRVASRHPRSNERPGQTVAGRTRTMYDVLRTTSRVSSGGRGMSETEEAGQ